MPDFEEAEYSQANLHNRSTGTFVKYKQDPTKTLIGVPIG